MHYVCDFREWHQPGRWLRESITDLYYDQSYIESKFVLLLVQATFRPSSFPHSTNTILILPVRSLSLSAHESSSSPTSATLGSIRRRRIPNKKSVHSDSAPLSPQNVPEDIALI